MGCGFWPQVSAQGAQAEDIPIELLRPLEVRDLEDEVMDIPGSWHLSSRRSVP
jgi:hypothetical protein